MKLMCRVLSVSEAGYYRYKRNCGKPSRDAVLSAAIMDMDRSIVIGDFNANPFDKELLRHK